MALGFLKSTVFLVFVILISCGNGATSLSKKETGDLPADSLKRSFKQKDLSNEKQLVVAANRTEEYLPLLKGKAIGIVGNQSSLILRKELPSGEKVYTHLVDSLLSLQADVKRVFSPEHGFRGTADAGETVKDGKDAKTGLPVISLYGNNKKPTKEQLQGLDILIFDIQDVGVRFYTYIATMHYIMEAAAEVSIPVIVLDRPNPNGHYVDGPTMEKAHTGFLGMHTGVPLVHGMTMGEYAVMINQEGWLKNGVKSSLTVIAMESYDHNFSYSLPVRPSPNLPNDKSINLYPSLGLLEGTNLNAGRGTEMQFQVLGSPHLPESKYPFSYIPQPNFGSKDPKHKGQRCYGFDLRETPRLSEVDLSWIIQAYQDHQKKEDFFNTANFTAHAGTAKLQQQIEAGLTMEAIRLGWKEDLDKFKKIRKKYLLYP